jgi:hypothetical protein
MKLDLNILELQVISIAITILLFELLQYGLYIKKWLKKPLHINIKPIDCGFCTSFWIGTIIALITFNPMLFITNFIISIYYGKNSK